MAASGNLKMSGSSSVFHERVIYRRQNGKFTSKKKSEKSSSGTKLAEKGRKRIFEERKGEGDAAAPHHEKRDDCDR